MKTKILLFISFIITIGCFAQSGINYKALIKDANGNVISNQGIDMIFTISIGGESAYSESQHIETNSNGIAIAVIGLGTTISGDFNAINWKARNAELNVQIDIGGGFIDFGNTPFNSVPYAIETLNKEGLEAIDEGNGIGWRLIGSNLANYGSIGFRATDLSYSNLESTTYGATGTNSTAMGVRTSANGDSSIALGSDSAASDDFSTAIGAGVIASGGSSTALGVGNQATGNSSTAIGYQTNASGFASTTLGYYTEASGSYATGIGNNTLAGAHSSVAIGRYNEGEGNATQWNDFDPIFEIGNGTSNSNRNNALTVSKNGRHEIRSSASGLDVFAASTGINIYNSGASGLYIYNPSFNGININYPEQDGIIINSPRNGIVISDATNDGARIFSDANGIIVQGGEDGARIIGNNVGVYASGAPLQADIPDIILGSSGLSQFSDDGIISTNPERSGSDMFLRSYDAVVIQLDYDGNENGNFRVRNSDQDVVFDVNESGIVSLGDVLRVGDINIERTIFGSLDFLRVNSSIMPNEDAEHILGAGDFRWINVWAVDGTINTSDRREKKNIEDLNYGLREVLQMKPVSFNWKNKNNQDTKLGLVAQDLETLIPEVVISYTWEKDETTGTLTKKELDRLGVYYSDLVPVLIKAIQEQQWIIKGQEEENNLQKAELAELQNNYQSLLSRIEIIESNTSN